MKNIHISRLFIDVDDNKLKICVPLGGEHMMNQHIYITSNEEIKEGDWCINLNSTYEHKELCRIDSQIELERYAQKIGNDCKKIILTTDQDLIKDGVQAIDDEFLEWFVKNPSCEFVKVIPSEFLADKIIYEVIIPQEEPKQETIEEAGVAYAKTVSQNHTSHMLGFYNGAKWQAERMYSEEDVQNLIKIIEWYDDNSDVRPNWDRIIDGLTMFEWFEQFKKK